MMTINRVKEWYESLTEKSLKSIYDLYSRDCFFKDPFNEFRGIDKISRVFLHMFEEMEKPRFIFLDMIDGGDQYFITWDFIFVMKGKEHRIHGSSHLKISNDKIVYHRDYWDVGEEVLLKIPVIRSIYGLLVNKLKVE